mmetsp:Transcript_12214/g.29427  ORF Transcript_12214/g.29427 Transcript_12214/m.29427 type:complete len:103 (-) Transcript_12214:870-1178(-)
MTATQAPAIVRKNPPHPIRATVDKNVELMILPTSLLEKLVRDMALARIVFENTSDGTSQAPGPDAIEKKDMKIARAMIGTAGLLPPKTKSNPIITKAAHIPA